MTTEAAETTAEPAESTASPFERAVARLEAAEVPAETPAAETPEPAEPAADPNVVDLPTLADIEKKAEERARERAEREALLEPVKAIETRISERLQTLETIPSLREKLSTEARQALQALGVDPDAVLQQLTQSKLAPDPSVAIREAVRAELQPLLQARQPQQPQTSAAPPLEEAEAIFAEYVGGAAELFPRLAAMPGELAAGIASRYVQAAAKRGIDTRQWTDEQIARAVERELSSGTPPSTNGTQQSPGTPSGTNGAPTSAPRSLTNGHAADGHRSKPTSYKERKSSLIARLEAEAAARR